MRRKDDGGAVGHFMQFVDEDGAFVAQAVDDKVVVDDFMAHINWRTELRDGAFDDIDRTVDTGTKSAGLGQQGFHFWGLGQGRLGKKEFWRRCSDWLGSENREQFNFKDEILPGQWMIQINNHTLSID